jgi:hypothetical protein
MENLLLNERRSETRVLENSMETPQALPLGLFLAGFWAATTSMLNASKFVNDLRDTVVIGRKDGKDLLLPHRRVLAYDWLLTMSGAVAFPLMYSVFLMVVVFAGGQGGNPPIQIALYGIACVPALGSLLFLLCGIADWRLMRSAMSSNAQK